MPFLASPSSRGDAHPNPFQEIDAARVPGSAAPAAAASTGPARGGGMPGALPASASQLQVGYQDPVLGYVELRAHSDGSGVHASLGTQSEAGRTALSGDLSALASWMDARHTPVESLSVVALHGTSNASSNLAGGRGGSEEFNSGSGPDARGGAEAGAGPGAGANSGHSSEDRPQTGRGAVPASSIGQGTGLGRESSSPREVAGFAPEVDFGVGGSISILA